MNLLDYAADFDRLECGSKVIELNAVSVTGTRNKQENNKNQDAFVCKATEEAIYMAVADGLGSCKFSEKGSRLAIECLEDWIKNDIKKYPYPSDDMITILNSKLIDRWRMKITEGHYKDYDTTLLYAILLNDHLIVGGIGDGMILCHIDKGVKEYSWDKHEFSNRTLSLSANNAKDCIRGELVILNSSCYPITLIMATDGVSEDLKPDMKAALPTYLHQRLMEADVITVQDEIEQWVLNWKTDNHTDDRTFCMVNIYNKR
ncbi:PP2C family serine/threonine-protein phosphatase [Neobacillus bataviensis]|uniref:PP2C family serine/threonine-protein phosphatase n=1 Tax=Neobacillus bataviensis TaxID=220685 RepID=UPI001CBDEDB5|nr:PP2C family serine/threonine-protein phosphatase [Neobacillus bataviensis]